MERLIQLEECCQSITQKFEHLWSHQRALNELTGSLRNCCLVMKRWGRNWSPCTRWNRNLPTTTIIHTQRFLHGQRVISYNHRTLSLLTTSISPVVGSIAPEYAEFCPPERSRIEELIRFVNVSALRSDSPSKLESHEREYNMLLNEDPEMYLCFGERNRTYRLLVSVLQTNNRFYLARLMLWRLYGWGLEIQVQKRLQFGKIKSGRGFYNKWSKVRDKDGMEALRVTAYGGQNVPVDVKSMETIWNGGLKLWSEWKDRLPLTFAESREINCIIKSAIVHLWLVVSNSTLRRPCPNGCCGFTHR